MKFLSDYKLNVYELMEKKYWIWFSLISDFGNVKKLKLLEIYKTPEKIFYLKNYENLRQFGENVVSGISNKKYKEQIYKIIDFMGNNGIDIVTMEDEYFPKMLREIYDCPISLYVKGNVELLNKENKIAIIGCREFSEYGKKCALYFSSNLAKKGVTIVSGLARGIDSFSHYGTIKADGTTIAVLGNGLDMIYPKENQKLAEEIVEKNGLLISEFPIGTIPEKRNFPARNRIISGISKGVIVIEAKKKSGTLLTVDFALDQGKDIYAVPGNINSINSVGTNDLIKQGAKLVTNFEEIDI